MGERKALLQSLDCAAGGADCKCAFLCGGQDFFFFRCCNRLLDICNIGIHKISWGRKRRKIEKALVHWLEPPLNRYLVKKNSTKKAFGGVFLQLFFYNLFGFYNLTIIFYRNKVNSHWERNYIYFCFEVFNFLLINQSS